jgi:hypothetical protein
MTAATTTRAKRKQDRESRIVCTAKDGASEKRGLQPGLLIVLLLFSSLLFSFSQIVPPSTQTQLSPGRDTQVFMVRKQRDISIRGKYLNQSNTINQGPIAPPSVLRKIRNKREKNKVSPTNKMGRNNPFRETNYCFC